MISVYEYSNSSNSSPRDFFTRDLISYSTPMTSTFVVDEIYRQSRNVVSRREPKFLGFAIQDDNIEIDMEIAVPFLSVPKKRGVGSRSRNLANINVAAVILAGFVALSGVFFGGAARYLNGGSFFDGQPLFRKRTNQNRMKRENSEENFIFHLMDNIDDSLKGIGFDSSSCLARSICWHVKNSNLNVLEKKAKKIDIFIDGFSKSDLVHRVVTNNFLREAIDAGKRGSNCEKLYNECALNPNNVEKFTQRIQQKVKPKKMKRHQMR